MNLNFETKKFAVLGFPVKHSRSPLIFNAAFQAKQKNALYQFIEQADTRSAIEGAKALGFSGLSVTLPHKLKAMDYVDVLDESAELLGCLNTIHFRDGKSIAYNFDGKGALKPLEAIVAKESRTDKKIGIIGAGGAAKAIALSLKHYWKAGAISLFVRNPQKAERLFNQLSLGNSNAKLQLISGEEDNLRECDILIQTTPIGMSPDSQQSPVSAHAFHKEQIVYDIVYTPENTRFLSDAQSTGAHLVYGKEMFLNQAALQYKCWFGDEAPMSVMKNILDQDLARQETK